MDRGDRREDIFVNVRLNPVRAKLLRPEERLMAYQ